MHGTVGFDSTDHYIPRNPIFNAVKEGALNIMRRIAMKKLSYLSYTYYYASFYSIIEQFFGAVKSGEEFPISLQKQLDVMRIIDSAYRMARSSSLVKPLALAQMVDSHFNLAEAK
jgi:hypothetical protein